MKALKREPARPVSHPRFGDQAAFNQNIIDAAKFYTVNLFLGRGSFERANADTLPDAVRIAGEMLRAYPACQAKPLIYAVNAHGASALVLNWGTP